MKKLKQIINIVVIAFLAMQTLHAQRIERFYTQMPEVLNPVISRQQRVELLEYFKADMGDSIQNRFRTQTRILKLDAENNHIVVQNTEISSFEMKLIPVKSDTIIGIIRTVCSPICQSTIEFYNLQWQRRTDITFTFPQAVDWINEERLTESSLNVQNVRNALNTSFISLNFDAETNEIIATNHSIQFLDQARQEQFTPIINNDTVFIYQLENKKWQRK
jgi:hypothetical protein